MPRSSFSAQVGRLSRRLQSLGAVERAENERSYLKSRLEHFGVPVPTIRRETRALLKELGAADRPTVLALAEALWAEPVHELRMAAMEVLRAGARSLEATDLPFLERLIHESLTWALVDALATDVVGVLLEQSPEIAEALDAWASDPDFWVRRAALLAPLRQLRKGEGSFERFARDADAMLAEKEFFIRKAIGWVLRETGKKRPELVVKFLEPRLHRASGLTVREATRNLDPAVHRRLMDAHRARRGRAGLAPTHNSGQRAEAGRETTQQLGSTNSILSGWLGTTQMNSKGSGPSES